MTPLSKILNSRKTAKVLGVPERPLPPGHIDPQAVDDMLADAGRAPFHYPAEERHRQRLASPVPWRFYKFDAASCRRLMALMIERKDSAGKILNMLAACDFLVMATWLPDDPRGLELPEGSAFHGTARNMEHIAATGAAINGLLLRATEEGFGTYWSSGGLLATPEFFRLLGLPEGELLLGAIFLFPQETGEATVVPGAWHDKRGEVSDWSAWMSVK